jgi:hypothetical protein
VTLALHHRARRLPRRVNPVAAVLLAIAVGLVGWTVLALRPAAGPAPAGTTRMPSSPEIEDAYGVRFTGAYLTAAGGMVELTYQVIDADKSVAVHEDEFTPVIVADGTTYDKPGLEGHGHGADFVAGRSYFDLLANVGGGLEVGDTVTIRVGDFELDGVTLG